MENPLDTTSNSLPNEQNVIKHLKSQGIPNDWILEALELIRHSINFLRVSEFNAAICDLDALPVTLCERSEIATRTQVREIKNRSRIFRKHAATFRKLTLDFWSDGFDQPRHPSSSPAIIDGERKFFRYEISNLIQHYSDMARTLEQSAKELEGFVSHSEANPPSAEKRSRNKFITDCCVAWVVPMRQKLTFTTGILTHENEARGPLADFIMIASKGVVDPANLDRKKLCGFLKSNKTKIQKAIEFEKTEKERYS